MSELGAWKIIVLPLALVAWLYVGRVRPGWWTPVGASLVLALAVEFIAWYMGRRSIPNHMVYNVYMAGEFLVLTWLVFGIPRPARASIRLALVCTVVFVAVYAWQAVSRHGWDPSGGFMEVSLVVGGTLLALQAFLGLYRLTMEGPTDPLRQPEVWFLASVCLYFISAAPLMGAVAYYAQRDVQVSYTLHELNDVLFIVRYGFMLVGCIQFGRLNAAG